jgi:hypothetical protein
VALRPNPSIERTCHGRLRLRRHAAHFERSYDHFPSADGARNRRSPASQPRTPATKSSIAVLSPRLAGHESPSAFSTGDLGIGHLIDSAANNQHRFVRAQFVQELVFPKYEQNEWVRCQWYNDVEWQDLIDLWRRYNLHLAHVIRHAPADALTIRCVIGDYEPVTLQCLIEDYVVHLKHHLGAIAERVAAGSTP